CDHRVAGDQGDVLLGPVAGGVDSAGHGPGVGPGPVCAGAKYRPGLNERRWDLLTDRYWFVSDDVPGTGQSPLQRNAANHRGSKTHYPLAGLELGAGSAVHVHPGLGLLTGPTGVPHGADHRRACPVCRHGVYLERHGRGDREAAAVLVAINSVFQLVAYAVLGWFYLQALPSWLGLATTSAEFSIGAIVVSVLVFLG